MPKAHAAQDGGAGSCAEDLAVAWRSFNSRFSKLRLRFLLYLLWQVRAQCSRTHQAAPLSLQSWDGLRSVDASRRAEVEKQGGTEDEEARTGRASLSESAVFAEPHSDRSLMSCYGISKLPPELH